MQSIPSYNVITFRFFLIFYPEPAPLLYFFSLVALFPQFLPFMALIPWAQPLRSTQEKASQWSCNRGSPCPVLFLSVASHSFSSPPLYPLSHHCSFFIPSLLYCPLSEVLKEKDLLSYMFEEDCCCCCSVAHWCLALCIPHNQGYGLPARPPVLHHLPGLTPTHVHQSPVMPSTVSVPNCLWHLPTRTPSILITPLVV